MVPAGTVGLLPSQGSVTSFHTQLCLCKKAYSPEASSPLIHTQLGLQKLNKYQEEIKLQRACPACCESKLSARRHLHLKIRSKHIFNEVVYRIATYICGNLDHT